MTIPTYKMIDYTYNDGGRGKAGYKGTTGDCGVRAVAILTGLDYQTVYKSAAAFFKSHGYAATGNAYKMGKKTKRGQKKPHVVQDLWYESMGFEKVKLPKGKKPTYTEAHELYGDCMVTTRKHICALKDGALHDTFDGREYEIYDRDTDFTDIRERKAMSVFVYKGVTQ